MHGALLAGTLLFFTGAGFTVWSANSNASMQLAAPDHLRGRIIGIYFYAFNGTGPARRPARRLALRDGRHGGGVPRRRRHRPRRHRCAAQQSLRAPGADRSDAGRSRAGLRPGASPACTHPGPRKFAAVEHSVRGSGGCAAARPTGSTSTGAGMHYVDEGDGQADAAPARRADVVVPLAEASSRSCPGARSRPT